MLAVQAQLPAIRLEEAPLASEGELALAHAPNYVADVVNGTLSDAAQREIGFPWSPAMAERSRRSVGATIAAARAALAKSWVSEQQGRVMDECLQLFGGYGFMNEYPIARMYTEARVQRIYGGTNEIMKVLIARGL